MKKSKMKVYDVKYATRDGNDSMRVSVKHERDIPKAIRKNTLRRKIIVYSVKKVSRGRNT